jgi:hypothetical protein
MSIETFEELVKKVKKLVTRENFQIHETCWLWKDAKQIFSAYSIWIYKDDDGYELGFEDEYQLVYNTIKDPQKIYNIIKTIHEAENES